MIRVFHLIKGLGRGGAEVLLEQGLRFADRGRFSLGYGYFLPWKNHLCPSLEAEGAHVVCFDRRSSLRMLTSVKRVAHELQRWNADLLHCHLPLSAVVGRRAARLAGIPVVYTEHNTFERYHPVTRWLNKSTYHLQASTVAVSADVADSIRDHVSGDPEVHTISNGIDVDRFDVSHFDPAVTRAELGIPGGAPVVGTVAVFRSQKDLHTWIAAADRLRQSHPNAWFLLVGDGPLRSELERDVANRGIRNVVFAGLCEDVRPLLSAMDVFVMTSRFEGLPLALLEALSMRRPVVATGVGGIPEVIDHDSNGILIPCGDPGATAEVLSWLLNNPSQGDELGREGRRTVESRFSVRRMTLEIEAVYDSVLARQ